MRPVVSVWGVIVVTALLAGRADAGCKTCGLPPAPAAVSSGGVYGGMGSWDAAAAPGWGNGLPYGGVVATNGPYYAPGGYEARIGSPTYYSDPAGGQYVVTGNPYNDHFGPGFHRDNIHGHYRFPYYNYRAPWYFPGRAVYNRNTNFAW